MFRQRDDEGGGRLYPTGLPPAEAGEDVPRWLAILGLVGGLTLFVALLRYAIDLLGVVFLIILVGFSIRAISDWLTEGESVSGWALSAVTVGLLGTLVVGIWLFGPRGLASDTLQRTLPGPIQRTVQVLESHGWGQRVLLPGGGPPIRLVEGPADSAPAARPDAPVTGPAPRSTTAVRPLPAPTLPSSPRRTAASRERVGEAEAAPGAAANGGVPPPASAPASEPAQRAASEVILATSPRSAVVGTSVRLTARVRSRHSSLVPRGTVTFYRGDEVLGRGTTRAIDGEAEATLITLSLPIGEHRLLATYDGDAYHAASQSAAVQQVVTRR